MNQQKIGKFIKEKRKEKGLTQVELAEKIGVSNRSISKWENGNCLPDYSIINDLCKTLDITINELLSGENIDKDKYQEKLEENIISTISYNNKKRNKRNIKILIITFIILYLLYKTLLIYLYYPYENKDIEKNTFPYNKNISTIKITNNDKANKEYEEFKLYIPNDFELVTDKLLSSFVTTSCDVYSKNPKSNDEFDAMITVCNESQTDIINVYNNTYYYSLFPYINYYTLMKKYNIEDELALIKFYEKNYKFKPNIFTKSSDIKMNYFARQYVNLIMPSYNNFYYLENDINGYLLDYKFKTKKTFHMTRFKINNSSYGISFWNNKEEYFNHDNVIEIISSIKE